MGQVKIRYYTVKRGRGFWQPTADLMREAGFQAGCMWPGRPGRVADGRGLQRALAGSPRSPRKEQSPYSRLCPWARSPRRSSAIGGPTEWAGEGTTDPRRMEPGLGSYRACLWRRAPAHRHAGTYQQISRTKLSATFRAGKRTASSRFGARFGGLRRQWATARVMLILRLACVTKSLSGDKRSGPIGKPSCWPRVLGGPDIMALPPLIAVAWETQAYHRLTCAADARTRRKDGQGEVFTVARAKDRPGRRGEYVAPDGPHPGRLSSAARG